MADFEEKRTKVFISYSHQDTEWLKRLRIHLKPLERLYELEIWDDTKIDPGLKWKEEIKKAVAASQVAVLLISADFLASDFIATDELPPLLDAAEKQGAVILPLILSPSMFLKYEKLAQFQSINDPSRPLISMTKVEQEAVLVSVVEQIEVASKRSGQTPSSRLTAPHEDSSQGFFHEGNDGREDNCRTADSAVSGANSEAEKSISSGELIGELGQKIPKYDHLVEALKDDLIAKLDSQLNLKTVPDVIRAAEYIEDYLLKYVRSALAKYSASIVSGSRYNPNTSEIEISGRIYEVRIREGILDSSLVEVALIQRQPTAPELTGGFKGFQIPGHGRYQHANIWLPDEIEFNREWFSTITHAVFQTGYLWLEERMRAISSNPEISFAMNLYSYLRTVIGNDELLGRIWLMCCAEGKGFFLLQPYTAFGALTTVGPSAPATGYSAMRLVTEFLGTDIQDEKLFSTIAAREGVSKDFDLKEAKFKDDLPLVLRAEISIFEAESIHIYPITKSASEYLVAVIPTRLRENILPVLELHKDELARRFWESHDHLSKMYKLIRDREASFDASSLGVFPSDFLADVLKHLGGKE